MIKKYSLSIEEQKDFSSYEERNAHGEALVFLCNILKREFPAIEYKKDYVKQAEGILKIHNDIGYMPIALLNYREELFSEVSKFIDYNNNIWVRI